MASKEEEIKTFRVGNNEVRTDELIHNILLGAMRFIESRNMSDEEKNALGDAYVDIMNRIEKGDNTLYLDDENRLVDTTGSIQENQYRSYGKILGYIIPIMKATKTYEKKNDKKEFSNALFTKDLSKHLGINDETQLANFIALDSPGENGQRGLTNRIAEFLKIITDLENKYNTEYSNYNSENISKIRDLLKDDNLSETERYNLGKATGIPDLYKIFTTETDKQNQTPLELLFEWLNTNYPYELVDDQIEYSFKDILPYDDLDSDLSSINALNADTINTYLKSLYNKPLTDPNEENQRKAIITASLERLLNLNQLIKISNNLYAIPALLEGTKVMVWNRENNTLKQYSTHDLDYYQRQYLLEFLQNNSNIDNDLYNRYGKYFTQYTSSYKKGGILKALNGTPFNGIYRQTSLKNWNNLLDKSLWNQTSNEHGYASDLNKAYELNNLYIGGNSVGKDILYYLDQGNYQDIVSFVEDYNNWAEKLRNFWNTEYEYNQDSTDIALYNDQFYKMFHSRLSNNPGFIAYQNNLKSRMGSNTWLRRMDSYEKEFDELSEEEKKSRIHTIKLSNGTGYKVYKKANGDIGILPFEYERTPEKLALEDGNLDDGSKVTPEGDGTSKTGDVDTDPLKWNYPEYEPEDDSFSLYPYLSDISRFLIGMGYNDKIKDLTKESIPLTLKNPYELYSPVTGAFGEMNMYKQQAAALRRRALELYTADPEKNAAIWAEYNKAALLLEQQGFIADNKEIKRTQSEALGRQEKNTVLRNQIANYNLELIDKFNATMKEIEAAHLQKNWASLNTLLSDLETRFTTYLSERNAKKEENRVAKNTVAKNTSLMTAKDDYQNTINSADLYKEMKGNEWDERDTKIYNLYKQQARKIYEARAALANYISLGMDESLLSELKKVAEMLLQDFITFYNERKAQHRRLGGVLQTVKSLKRK